MKRYDDDDVDDDFKVESRRCSVTLSCCFRGQVDWERASDPTRIEGYLVALTPFLYPFPLSYFSVTECSRARNPNRLETRPSIIQSLIVHNTASLAILYVVGMTMTYTQFQ